MNWKKFVLEVCSDKFEILKWNFGNNYFREKLKSGLCDLKWFDGLRSSLSGTCTGLSLKATLY